MYINNENEKKVYDQFYSLESWERLELLEKILMSDAELANGINEDVYEPEENGWNVPEEYDVSDFINQFDSDDILSEMTGMDIAYYVSSNDWVLEDILDEVNISTVIEHYVKQGELHKVMDEIQEMGRTSLMNWLEDKIKG